MFRGGKNKMPSIDTLVGHQTLLRGDIHYRGGLHVDGTIKGNVIADDDPESVLSVSERGVVEGDVHVYNIILNGKVVGDVHALEKIELAALRVGREVCIVKVGNHIARLKVAGQRDLAALINPRQKPAAPVRRTVDRLSLAEHHEAGQVLVFGAQSVQEPRSV